MHSIIEDILRRLGKYPQARIQHDDTSVSCLPADENGFVVRLRVIGQGDRVIYSVLYNGSHEEFEKPQQAILEFMVGLSTLCQLREYSRVGRAYRWCVEFYGIRGWKPDWEIVQLTNPACWMFWVRPTVRILQNRLIDIDEGPAGATVAASR